MIETYQDDRDRVRVRMKKKKMRKKNRSRAMTYNNGSTNTGATAPKTVWKQLGKMNKINENSETEHKEDTRADTLLESSHRNELNTQADEAQFIVGLEELPNRETDSHGAGVEEFIKAQLGLGKYVQVSVLGQNIGAIHRPVCFPRHQMQLPVLNQVTNSIVLPDKAKIFEKTEVVRVREEGSSEKQHGESDTQLATATQSLQVLDAIPINRIDPPTPSYIDKDGDVQYWSISEDDDGFFSDSGEVEELERAEQKDEIINDNLKEMQEQLKKQKGNLRRAVQAVGCFMGLPLKGMECMVEESILRGLMIAVDREIARIAKNKGVTRNGIIDDSLIGVQMLLDNVGFGGNGDITRELESDQISDIDRCDSRKDGSEGESEDVEVTTLMANLVVDGLARLSREKNRLQSLLKSTLPEGSKQQRRRNSAKGRWF